MNWRNTMSKKKEVKKPSIDIFFGIDTIWKLRLIITIIFALSTLAIILILVGDYVIAPILFFISYLMVLILAVKLFLVRKL